MLSELRSKPSPFANAQLIGQRGGRDDAARSTTSEREQIVLVSRDEPIGSPSFA